MQNTTKSNKIAFIGTFSSLACSIMIFFGIASLGFGAFAVPIISMIVLCPVLYDFGPKNAFAAYLVTAILSLLICPDKETAFVYLFFGWHPIFSALIRKRRLLIEPVIKLLTFSVTSFLMVSFCSAILGIDYSLFLSSRIILYTSLILAIICYFMLDYVFIEFENIWQKKLKDKFGAS